MRRIKKWWIALLLGALLTGLVVGAAGARPKASPAYKVTIPGGHFHPHEDGMLWYNSGYELETEAGTACGTFTAALPIALPGRFTVEKMTLFAYDANGSSNICADLYRVNPFTYSEDHMGAVCTTGSSGNQNRSTTTFTIDTIYGGHGAYIWLNIGDDSNLHLNAVQIDYH